MKAVICPITANFFAEDQTQRFTAIIFRNKIYVASPRHLDCINLAFKGMTENAKNNISNRIANGKEKILFGSALGDGSEWEWDKKSQNPRMEMYGFK